MKNDRIQSNTIQKAETQSKFIKLVQNSSANLYDRKFSGLNRIGGRGEDPQVTLDLALAAERVEQSCYGVLRVTMNIGVKFEQDSEHTNSVGLSHRGDASSSNGSSGTDASRTGYNDSSFARLQTQTRRR